ncbi:carbohydrate kinase [Prevotella sp. HUN102]|uniref:carbohydrate kinase family protein n=1 Tax=Prevotella sp. HUN102 TaxID=1392486 RepID=UPI00048DA0AC|nr:carbohydrate kinase [Prevotella sp. HUN102]
MKQVIVGLGEALWDCLPEGKKIGGAPANFAFHAGQFGHDTIAISAVGTDGLGTETLAKFDSMNVHYVMPRVDFPTGTVNVTLDAAGIPTYEIKEGVAWDNIPFTPEIEEIAKTTRAVCFGSLAQRNKVSRETIQKFLDSTPMDCLKIFDINLRQHFYGKEIITNSLKQCNVLKINDDEIKIVADMFGWQGLSFEDTCWLLLGKYNLDIVVLTCGTNGSYVFAPNTLSFQETPKVEVADTVGAGDSFTGTFTAAILSGMPITEAHKIAVEASAFVCTKNGAMPILPQHILERVK